VVKKCPTCPTMMLLLVGIGVGIGIGYIARDTLARIFAEVKELKGNITQQG